MADGSKIEWTDATWNPVIGCTKVSPGCDHCYAIRTAHRMQANPNPKVSAAYAGTEEGGEWTGRINLLGDRLDQPLRWRTPRRIFVNAQSDLFHKDVPDEFIARVWAVMALAPQHTFQILTKRHGRMRSLLSSDGFAGQVGTAIESEWTHGNWHRPADPPDAGDGWSVWPLPNVWLGVSVEDQVRADLRVPALLDTPAAVRWLSCEPLLGPVDLSQWLCDCGSADDFGAEHSDCSACRCTRYVVDHSDPEPYHPENVDREESPDCPAHTRPLHWIVAGGESGPGARPMHPEWARSLRDQCVAAGVPFLLKQWGEWAPAGYSDSTHLIQVTGQHVTRESATVQNPYGHGSGTQDLVDRGHPGWARIRRPGKRFAGRTLDGRTWDQYPDGEQ